MRLTVKFAMHVRATKRSERDKAAELNADIERTNIRRAMRAVDLDESLTKDFNRIIADLAQLMNRADARKRIKDGGK